MNIDNQIREWALLLDESCEESNSSQVQISEQQIDDELYRLGIFKHSFDELLESGDNDTTDLRRNRAVNKHNTSGIALIAYRILIKIASNILGYDTFDNPHCAFFTQSDLNNLLDSYRSANGVEIRGMDNKRYSDSVVTAKESSNTVYLVATLHSSANGKLPKWNRDNPEDNTMELKNFVSELQKKIEELTDYTSPFSAYQINLPDASYAIVRLMQ